MNPMNSSQQPMDDAGRKRHLEALFADDPFLSPTMMARRMHEKMVEMRSRETAAPYRPVGPFLPSDAPYSVVFAEAPDIPAAGAMSMSGTRISMAEARVRLSEFRTEGAAASGQMDPMFHFRTRVLAIWAQKVDRREVE